MKIVLSGLFNPLEINRLAIDKHKNQLFAEFIYNKVIMAGKDFEFNNCVKEILSSPSNQNVLQIIELFKKLPLTEKNQSPPVDFSLNTNEKEEFSDLPFSNQIINLFNSRQPQTQKGLNRSEIYKKVLSPFSTTAKGVFCLDPYVIENYMENSNDSFLWTVKNFAKDGIEFINIFTRLWNANERFEYDMNHIKERITKDLNKNKINELKIKLIFGFSNHMDRHFRFYYSSQRLTPVINFGKGFAVFESELLKSAHAITLENPKSAYNREIEIEQTSRGKNIQIIV